MADKRIAKALYGPSTVEVALGALLGLLAGVLVACVYLVWKPVQKVNKLPAKDKIVAGAIYYIPGNENTVKGRDWQAKQKTLFAGGEVLLSEEELNAWAATLTAPPAPAPAKSGAKPKPGAAASNAFLVPDAPNFRIVGDKLQIGFKCTLNYFGVTYDVIVHATGAFAKLDGRFEFEPETFYLGSCPLHKLPKMPAFFGSRLIAAEKVPDDVSVAWSKVSAIGVEGGLLKVATAK